MTLPPLSTVPPTARSVPAAVAEPRGRTERRGYGVTAGTRFAPYLFLLPYFLVTVVFFLYPLFYASVLSFYQTDGPGRRAFVGLSNFRFVLGDPDFHKALKNTTVFTLCSILVQLPLSLALAMLLNAKRDRLKGVFRLIIFSPNLVGQVFVGIVFTMLFTPHYGLFNKLLHALVGWNAQANWLFEPQLVMPAIVIASLWLYVGFNMIYFLAALQSVDQTLVEAAKIDGAGPVSTFLNVTVPAIAPVTTFVVVTSTINSFQLFELPFTLLQNSNVGYGPDNAGLTIVGYLYRYAFENGDLGTASTVGWLLTFLIFGVSLVQIRIASRLGSER